jgi:hypothetical protein
MNRRPSSWPPTAKEPAKQADFAAKFKTFEAQLKEFDRLTRNWTDSAHDCARGWYNEDLENIREKARTRAEEAVGRSDFSTFRGRGPEFVLEFTAIVVIIFSAVILGIGGILGAEQIGTLLAAIAGYVLGRGVSRSASGPSGVTRSLGTRD